MSVTAAWWDLLKVALDHGDEQLRKAAADAGDLPHRETAKIAFLEDLDRWLENRCPGKCDFGLLANGTASKECNFCVALRAALARYEKEDGL